MAIDYSATDHAFTKGYITGLAKRADLLIGRIDPNTEAGRDAANHVAELLADIIRRCED